jgi:hypothetical protein
VAAREVGDLRLDFVLHAPGERLAIQHARCHRITAAPSC